MNAARQLLAMSPLMFAMHVQAADWNDNDITEILSKVRTIYSDVTGDVKDAARDLVLQQQMRAATTADTVSELLAWFETRRAPFLDFVNGGTGRCGQGSECARFRTDLRTFALQMAELKDQYPVLNQHALGDPTFFANTVNALPPFVLFGINETLRLIPNWQDLPVDLADMYDEIDDPAAFSVTLEPSPQVTAASVDAVTRKALATDRLPAAALGKQPSSTADTFCSQGRLSKVDAVRLNKLKSSLYRWKNRFDSYAEYPPDAAELTLAGEGTGAFKIPVAAFLKTVSNAIDSILNMVDTNQANFEVCAKIEADVAACAPMVEYRTAAGSRKAYWVTYGIVNRLGNVLAGLQVADANIYLSKAKIAYNNAKWKDAYNYTCQAYAAL